MDEQTTEMETSNKEAENNYRVKKKTFDLLPESEENLNKLMVCAYNGKFFLMFHLLTSKMSKRYP